MDNFDVKRQQAIENDLVSIVPTGDIMNEHEIVELHAKFESVPFYKCHKVVKAARIVGIQGTTLMLEFPSGIKHHTVSLSFFTKHTPQAGGYFILYKDGYTSFSPAEAFLNGYTPYEPDRDDDLILPPRAGAIAKCSIGRIGLITSNALKEVTYNDGSEGIAWTGIQLESHPSPANNEHILACKPGDFWCSRTPEVLGYIDEFRTQT